MDQDTLDVPIALGVKCQSAVFKILENRLHVPIANGKAPAAGHDILTAMDSVFGSAATNLDPSMSSK